MMKQLTKKQIKLIATLHSAIHLANVDIWIFDEVSNITDKEQYAILEEINLIADKLSKGMAMNLGSTSSIVDYVRNNY